MFVGYGKNTLYWTISWLERTACIQLIVDGILEVDLSTFI